MMTVRTRRLLVGILALGFTVIVLSGYVIVSASIREERANAYRSALASQEQERRIIAEIMQGAFAPEFRADAPLSPQLADLPLASRSMMENIIAAKRVLERFYEQERLLASAGALLSQNKNDPIAAEYLERAKTLNDSNVLALQTYDSNILPLQALVEISGDCDWNARLQYLMGAIHYRSLVFVSKEEQSRAFDIIKQAVDSFERVFKCRPKDRAAEVAIEKLFKAYEERGGSGKTPKKSDDLRLDLLPKPGNNDPGTGGADRQRGRH